MSKEIKRLILGDGLLGSTLHRITGWPYISRKKDKFDLSLMNSPADHNTLSGFYQMEEYDEIINCIACTDTYSADREKHWKVNYEGLASLVDWCSSINKKLIHISTDYIYTFSENNASEESVPVHCNTWYGYTKLLGDGYVQLKSKNYLLIRTTQKKYPFTYEKAYLNQVGNFDYVNVIADLIIKLIEKNTNGIFNVGTELKSMYDLALKSKPDVKPTLDLFNDNMPKNVSMNITKMLNMIKQ